jgi:leucyl-tRNA synthetase
MYRFLGRIWRLFAASLPKLGAKGAVTEATGAALELRRRTHRTIVRVTQQLDRLQFNTAISSLMELSNAAQDLKAETPGDLAALHECLSIFAQLLSPFAPHLAEEVWAELKAAGLAAADDELTLMTWPVADAALTAEDVYSIAVQVNGKLRGEVQVPSSATEEEIRAAAAADPKVKTWLDGKTLKKCVVIPKRLVNFVVAG